MASHEDTAGRILRLPVEQLVLDKDNPRLASSFVNEPSQRDLVRILWNEMAVDEVALSIAANGFYADEPLLVVPQTGGGSERRQRYIVVEGNRRLAAVLLLRDPGLRDEVKATNLPVIDEGARRALDTLPVSIKADRRSIWAYVGFRHVNGTRPWDAFSKAKYAAHVHEHYGVPLKEIAERIGDRHSTVERMYRGHKVLRQAEEMAGFDREDRIRNRFFFSHLYTAVDQPEFQKFLGITADRWERSDPVPKSRLQDLSDLMTWLYGRRSTNTQPIIRTQAPDLSRLRSVIGSPAALSLLRHGYSLDRAFDTSIGDRRRFREALSAAKEELQKAKATVTTGYSGEEDLLDTMEAILLTATSISDEMKTKPEAMAARRRAR